MELVLCADPLGVNAQRGHAGRGDRTWHVGLTGPIEEGYVYSCRWFVRRWEKWRQEREFF